MTETSFLEELKAHIEGLTNPIEAAKIYKALSGLTGAALEKTKELASELKEFITNGTTSTTKQ